MFDILCNTKQTLKHFYCRQVVVAQSIAIIRTILIFSSRVQIPPESEDVDEEWSINHLKKHRIFCASHVRSFAENVSKRSSCLKRRISIRRSPNWLKEFYKGEWRKYFAFNKGEHGLIAQQEENGSNVFEDSTVSSKLNPEDGIEKHPRISEGEQYCWNFSLLNSFT